MAWSPRASVIISGVLFGRRVGIVFWVMNLLTFVGIGLLVDQGVVTPSLTGADPRRLDNWIRVGFSSTAVIGFLATAVGFIIRHIETREANLRAAYEQLQHLHVRVEAAKEEERRSLSRELHDEFGQTLTALKLRLKLAARTADTTADPDVLSLVDSLTARVRKISVDLRPALLDELGLGPALQAHVDALGAACAIRFTLVVVGFDERLAPNLEIACFRVIQESITNAIRHADPRTIDIQAKRQDQNISLVVTDDGSGFDPASRIDRAAGDGHLGVVGMRERVRILGGTFSITSQPGAGTTVAVSLRVT